MRGTDNDRGTNTKTEYLYKNGGRGMQARGGARACSWRTMRAPSTSIAALSASGVQVASCACAVSLSGCASRHTARLSGPRCRTSSRTCARARIFSHGLTGARSGGAPPVPHLQPHLRARGSTGPGLKSRALLRRPADAGRRRRG
jgi:hypothetical protein